MTTLATARDILRGILAARELTRRMTGASDDVEVRMKAAHFATLATLLEPPSCATCRWARTPDEGREPVGERLARAGFPLRCELAEIIETQYPDEAAAAKLANRMCVTIDGSDYRGDLYVRPDFGCVQWEGKP